MKFCSATILSITFFATQGAYGFQFMKPTFGSTKSRSIISIGMGSYLDQLSSPNEDFSAPAPAPVPVPSGGNYLDALSGGGAAPLAPAPAPVIEESPPAPSGGSYLDALNSGAVAPAPATEAPEPETVAPVARTSGSYLDSMSSGAAAFTGGSGPVSYLDSMSSSSSSSPSGSGLSSYLDSVGGAASTSSTLVPAAAAAAAATPCAPVVGDDGLDDATRELLDTVNQVETEFVTRLGQLTSEKEAIQAQLEDMEMAKNEESAEKANLQEQLATCETQISSLHTEKDQGVSQVRAAILRLRKLIE